MIEWDQVVPPGTQPEYIKVVAALIQDQMDLPEDRVLLYNQKFDIPSIPGVFVSLSILGDKPFGASSEFTSEGTGEDAKLIELQGVNVQEIYSIMIYSQNSQARVRRHEVLFALNGVPSQQAQERYNFKIGNLPTDLLDVSEVDGSSRLNRYNLTFRALVSYSRRRSVEYFKDFTGSPEIIINP